MRKTIESAPVVLVQERSSGGQGTLNSRLSPKPQRLPPIANEQTQRMVLRPNCLNSQTVGRLPRVQTAPTSTVITLGLRPDDVMIVLE